MNSGELNSKDTLNYMKTIITNNKEAILHECSKKSLKVNNLPFYYSIHLNMSCNQRCIMCTPYGNHPKDLFPFDKFANLFEQIKPFAEHITLIGGEPLIYPWINEVIDLLSQHQIEVTINTNATMLSEKLSLKLLSLYALNLRCSIDAASHTTYLKIRGADCFDRVKTNLEHFSAITRNDSNIRQILDYVVMRENLNEVLPFIDFAKTLCPHRVEFHPVVHVTDWLVSNESGWVFNGKEQSCEYFRKEYNSIMKQASSRCEMEGLSYEVQLL